jgi:hypothetical protein
VPHDIAVTGYYVLDLTDIGTVKQLHILAPTGIHLLALCSASPAWRRMYVASIYRTQRRGVRTEYNRRLARRRPPGGAGWWCGVWCTGARTKLFRPRQRQCIGRTPPEPVRGITELTPTPFGLRGARN